MMEFQTDKRWNLEELALHRESFDLKLKMDKCYGTDVNEYQRLAKRYHEIANVLNDDG